MRMIIIIVAARSPVALLTSTLFLFYTLPLLSSSSSSLLEYSLLCWFFSFFFPVFILLAFLHISSLPAPPVISTNNYYASLHILHISHLKLTYNLHIRLASIGTVLDYLIACFLYFAACLRFGSCLCSYMDFGFRLGHL